MQNINHITLNYNGESISLPVYHNGVDLEWLPELGEYLQDILDQIPKPMTQNYTPVSYQILEYRPIRPNPSPTGEIHITHIITFNSNPHRTQLFSRIELERAFSEAFWDDADFVSKVITTYNTITVVIESSN